MIHIFKALADETRLRLLAVLAKGDFNVNELIEILQMGQSRISRHLKILSDSGLIAFRREGNWIYYSLAQYNGNVDLVDASSLAIRGAGQLESYEADLQNLESVVQRRRSLSKKYFDRVGPNWEQLQKEVLDSRYYQQIVFDYLPTRKQSAVDLGAGAGLLLPGLIERFENVIAIDSSQTMLKVASDHLGREQPNDLERCDFRLGELEHLPISDRNIDAAIACMVLHHVSNPSQAISEVHRILRKNGTFVIADLQQHDIVEMREKYADLWLGFKRADLRKWLKAAGFEIQKQRHYKKRYFKILIFQATKI